HLRDRDELFPHQARSRVRQRRTRGRGEPRAGQDPGRAARGDGGATGHARGPVPHAARSVHRHRDAKPGRVRGDLPASRGGARPARLCHPGRREVACAPDASASRRAQGRSGDRRCRCGRGAPEGPRPTRRSAVIQPRKRRKSRLPFVPLPRLLALVLLSAVPIALATFYEPPAWGAVAILALAIVLAVIDARATRLRTPEDVTREIAEQPSLRAANPVRLT